MQRIARFLSLSLLSLTTLLTASVRETQAPLPGMPPVIDASNIYSESAAGKIRPDIAGFPQLVYVPGTQSHTVDVIDPKTYKIIRTFKVAREPQHVTPSYDMKTLWVGSDLGNVVTRIDPATGQVIDAIPVEDPYNMYFTPDGQFAIIVAERKRRLDFRDPNTMKLAHSISAPDCAGIDHMDFSADGRYAIATCEFAGKVIKVDMVERKLAGTLLLRRGGMPQDVKLSPDGRIFYVADMMADGVHLVDGDTLEKIGFIQTGKGAHGLYASRDAKVLFVSNRGEGSISLVDFASRSVMKKWTLPRGASPDMGNVSADGKSLWLSGRYSHEVYVIDTENGNLLARIPTGRGPHGLCLYPIPGRYSLGHTGICR